MGRRHDVAWKHCTSVKGKANHVKCNYCGHLMWGGVSRLKEHLAKKRGDVIPCQSCPSEVTAEMRNLLIQQSRAGEEKHKRKRESLELMQREEVDKKKKEEEEEEANRVDQAIKESILTYEMEKRKAEMDERHAYEVACHESLAYYEMEKKWRGEGCSSSGTKREASSHPPNSDSPYHFDFDLKFDPDYDSELGF